MIKVSESKLHWNYYLALEHDMENVARFIEFFRKNFGTYSIELAHLLFASASEVDVVAKSLCELLAPNSQRKNVVNYRPIITRHLPQLARERVYIPRYGLTLDPWSSWRSTKGQPNPLWWTAYNEVKHERNEHFEKANLKNTLNALGGLLVITFYYYREKMLLQRKQEGITEPLRNADVTLTLEPQSSLMRLKVNYYVEPIWVVL